MASLIPHPPYAEDQPLPRTLLTAHVTHRTLQSGAFLSLPISLATIALSARRTGTPLTRAILLSSSLRSVGTGALIGALLGAPMTFGRMRGKEEIEWKDRAWRLLENRGQVEVEGWSAVGAVLGAVVAARRGVGKGTGGLVRMVGAAAVGDFAGVMGYLGWRYGLGGGRRGGLKMGSA